MRVLGLPGRKASTVGQMQALLAALGALPTAVQSYGFWSLDEDHPDPEIGPEVECVASSGAELFVAKSIGTLIAMRAISEHGLAGCACVFTGTPIRRLRALGLVPLLRAHCEAVETLFVQQLGDFNGPFAELVEVTGAYPRCRNVEIPGDDHLYADVGLVAANARSWLSSRTPSA